MSLQSLLQKMKGGAVPPPGSPGSPSEKVGGTAQTRIPPSGSPGSLGSLEKNNVESENAAGRAVPPPPRPSPGLLEVIKRMADFYEYEPDELTYVLDDARKNPDTWRELIRNDRNAALFVNPLPEHQLEVVHMLRADSALRYAFTTKEEGGSIIVTLAVRDVAVCDLTIPASHYNPLTFWKTIQEVTHD